MSFRKYGGLQYSSKNHAVSSNYNTSNNLLVTQNFGQPDSYVNFESDISGNINIDIGGNAHIGGNMYIEGNETIHGNIDVSGNVYITGNLDISGNENIGGNLDVTGNSLLRNGVSINYPQGHLQNTNYALDISGNERVIGNLDISGNGILTVGTSLFTNTGKLNINENVGTGPYTQTSPGATPVPFISGGSQVYAGSLVIRHNNDYGYSSILFPCRTGYPNFGDYGYIQYFEYVNEGFPQPVPESGLLLIGIENDAPYSRISLYPNKGTGFVGINTMYPQYSLDISGNERVTGNLDISGNERVTGNVDISGNVTISGNLNVGLTNTFNSPVNFAGGIASTSSNYPLASTFNNPAAGYIGYTFSQKTYLSTYNYIGLTTINTINLSTGIWICNFICSFPNSTTTKVENYFRLGITSLTGSWNTPDINYTSAFNTYYLQNYAGNAGLGGSTDPTNIQFNYIYNSSIWSGYTFYIQLFSLTAYTSNDLTCYQSFTRIA